METEHCRSAFILTFTIELLGIDVWEDCLVGCMELGPPCQGIKLQYLLNTGQIYDIDVLVWPHCVKIWCGSQYGWARTWLYLQRRWTCFSIRHLSPVRIIDFRNHVVTITPTVGLGSLSGTARNDKNTRVNIPALSFGEKRYFGRVVETEETEMYFMLRLILELIAKIIPPSYLDGPYDLPQVVTNVRHQDAVISEVRDIILNPNRKRGSTTPSPPLSATKSSIGRKQTPVKPKSSDPGKKFELKLTGQRILAGVGKTILSQNSGLKSSDLGEIFVVLSSTYLPADDDLPMVFVNVEKLFDVPVKALEQAGFQDLYTKWNLGNTESVSQKVALSAEVDIDDHCVVPLEKDIAVPVVTSFLNGRFEIEIRGTRVEKPAEPKKTLFGFDKTDKAFDKNIPQKNVDEPKDVIIALCKVDAKEIAKGHNCCVRRDYPVFPPRRRIIYGTREAACTNDINAIGLEMDIEYYVPPSVILEAQMTMEVSLGYVGCRLQKFGLCFSRFYCLINETIGSKAILDLVKEINDDLISEDRRHDLLTGFAVDTGCILFVYLEGPKDREILKVWDLTADFNESIETYFSTSDRYYDRLYSDILDSAVPFLILKMHCPLNSLLVCPAIYVNPALPKPARNCVLKLGRLIGYTLREAPTCKQMPTIEELRSFRLELCPPPKPANIANREHTQWGFCMAPVCSLQNIRK